MDILDHLTKEHRKVEQLLHQLDSSDDGEQRRVLVRQLSKSLEVHMTVEELALYPIVTDLLGEETGNEAEAEHTLTREGLAKLNDIVDEPGFIAAVEMLQAGIGHHVSDEEEKVFPQLREQASEQLAKLDPDELEQRAKEQLAKGSVDLTKEELYRQAQEAEISGRSSMTKEELAQAVAEV